MRLLDPRNRWAQRYGWLVTVIPLLLLFTGPLWWWWLFRPAGPTALVVNKTVPLGNLREHASLGWVLHHQKVAWGDYLGPHFQGQQLVATPRVTEERLQGIDRLFLCDTYGIYRGDENRRQLERLDGGLDAEEVGAIERFSARGGALYGEFNCLAHPTVGASRRRLEKLFGLRFSGWTGRFFPDLADRLDLPGPGLEGTSGPGYLLFHEDGRVLVLTEPLDVHANGLNILLEKPLADCSQETPFGYWFDIVTLEQPAQLQASFHFSLTPQGRAKFKAVGLSGQFPAIVTCGSNLYCCGDFSDNEISRGPYWLEGWPAYCRWRYQAGPDPSRRFFWTLYLPLIEWWLGRGSAQAAGSTA